MNSSNESPVIVEKRGRVGHLTLNRPKAINALTYEMVGIIQTALDEWVTDEDVQTVLLTGSGERGLCAGGDIVSMYYDAKAGGNESAEFWRAEYILNATIANYPKPYVAIMDGIVLGGGIGLSAHGNIRVVTEKSKVGMPETGIGFLPDVGGTFLLSRTPGETGTHLALTAGSIRAGDAIALGLADYYVLSEKLDELIAGLETSDAKDLLGKLAESAPESSLVADRDWIDSCYAGDDLATIVQRLREHESVSAHKAADTIDTKSPTSCAVTLRAIRNAAEFYTVEEALNQEYRLALGFHASAEFVEGVRAQVIDKDRNPQWNPPSISALTGDLIDSFFATRADELGLGSTPQTKE